MPLIRLIRFCLLTLIVFTEQSYAQRENSTWLFGKGLGMSFQSGVVNPLPAPAHASQRYITSTACISDKRTGKLIFYTNGKDVFNRLHQPMPTPLNNNFTTDHLLIVPDPGDTMQYYILYSYSQVLYYAKVDLRLQNGLGNVSTPGIMISMNKDDRFAVVKQLYNAGYWLITHIPGTTTFESYRINKDGIQSTSVSSTTSEDKLWPYAQTFYSEIVVTTTGNQFAVMDNNSSKPNDKNIWVYDFDKKCGTVSLKKQLSAGYFIYDIAFDAQAKYLYVISSAGGGDRNIVQYDLLENNNVNDALSSEPVISGNEPMRHLKLAPDDKIYITKEEMIGNGYSSSRYIDMIHNPSSKGSDLIYQEHALNLSPNNICFNDPCYLTDRFNHFIEDRTLQQPLHFEEPIVHNANYCLGQTTTFKIEQSNIQMDSFHWDFGDTTAFSNALSTTHTYQHPGNYNASFNWYLCGQQYKLVQKIAIGKVPEVNLGNDTTICNGHDIKLKPREAADKYLWSTGDTTYEITVGSAGKYSITVMNGDCGASDVIYVDYYPPLWTTLGDEYFICDRDKELVKLDAGEGYTKYKWTPTGDTAQWIVVGDLGNYFVIVNDFRGCDGMDGTTVKRICPVELFFPNAFTPNNDGVNDTYLPIGNSIVSFEIKIYNRWGMLVYESTDVNQGWNGKIKDTNANTDVYYYTSTYTGYINKRLTHFDVSGNFTLLK